MAETSFYTGTAPTPLDPPAGFGSDPVTDNAIARWDGTSGTLLQNSGVIIDDSDNVSGIVTLSANAAAIGSGASGSTSITSDAIEIGVGRTGDGNSIIDFHSQTGTDYDFRIYRNPGADGAIQFIQNGTGTWAFTHTGAGHIRFDTSNTERMRIDNAGAVVIGGTAAVSYGAFAPNLQVHGTGTAASMSVVGRYSVDDAPARLILAKSRVATIGAHTAVAASDRLGTILFQGSDGTGFIEAALIQAKVDGAVGTNDMPTRLEFATTADGASSATERLRIDSAGVVVLGGVAAQAIFPAGTANFQMHGTGTAGASPAFARWSADTGGPNMSFLKSRGASVGASAAVGTNDTIARINFVIDGGTSTYLTAARIEAAADGGTMSTTSAPGKLLFSTTPDGSTTLTERMRISAGGGIGFGTQGSEFSGIGFGHGYAFGQHNGNSSGSIILMHAAASATGPYLTFAKSRGASFATWSVVSSGDTLGEIYFYGGDGTNGAQGAKIGAYVDGTPGNDDMPGRLQFFTTPDASATSVERMRIDSTGDLLVGSGTAITFPNIVTPRLQITGTDGQTGAIGISRFGATASAANLYFAKSRHATPGSHTVVSNGDFLFEIAGGGSDGDEFLNAASILAFVDGTPGNGDMPGALMFATTSDGAASPTERLRISSNGLASFTNTAGFGYGFAGNGDGGTVTQITNKATGVTLNTVNGQITLNSAALAAGTTVTFTLTNSKIAASDHILLHHQSAGTAGAYTLNAQCAAGSATINVRNVTAGSLSEAIVISFAVIKGTTT